MAQVEERLVGAVLGPAGRYVEEIKQYRSQGYNKTPLGCSYFEFDIWKKSLITAELMSKLASEGFMLLAQQIELSLSKAVR